VCCVCESRRLGPLGTEQDGAERAERLLNCIMRQHKARSGDCGLHCMVWIPAQSASKLFSEGVIFEQIQPVRQHNTFSLLCTGLDRTSQ
jgi:hypothetical protein